MRTGLLLSLRSCIHRSAFAAISPAFASASSDRFQPLPCRLKDSNRQSAFTPSLNNVRPILCSSTASTFEAPEPPKSHGQPVFPDIRFRRSPSEGESNDAATIRNADPEAVFVVTGSNRGIGLQFVISLLERTKGKIIACCRSPSSANELKEIGSKHTPERMQILPLNLEEQSSIETLASNIAQSHRRVDALFNVAGILGDGTTTPGPERSLANVKREWFDKTLAVNVVGPTMLTKALSPLMRTTGRRSIKMDVIAEDGSDKENNNSNQLDVTLPTGRPPTVVVNLSARVGSISDNQLGGWYSYRISKAALNQSTRTMSLELKRQGTLIVGLHPGTTDTDLSKPFQRNVREGRLFPVEFTVDRLLAVVESIGDENTGGFYDWAGKALPF
eukprot:CAMPEP_0172544234 /NCGR_PEP_ID=MMETSP1067-20121228/14433_1 /TAXON_ID=265564 ORGANISM="Thalassiosira punctigera, Strain Tpunct2005C2" /NCGR_SAMPLE_ID=MMETSP1067 /ASSEMBLY_ACC=CAM_ASM_000444 /LENGTH=388 /DNA_ID=CAMNT_0013330761 /DNA_START=105 /DNA_END=1271 /DNA_ORIENTATION=+